MFTCSWFAILVKFMCRLCYSLSNISLTCCVMYALFDYEEEMVDHVLRVNGHMLTYFYEILNGLVV